MFPLVHAPAFIYAFEQYVSAGLQQIDHAIFIDITHPNSLSHQPAFQLNPSG